MNRITDTNFFILCANTVLPVINAEVNIASHGSLSTVSGTSSVAMMRYQDLDIFAEAASEEGAAIDVYAGHDGNMKKLFSGVLDEFDIDFDADTVSFQGRDHAANMADTKQVVSDINYKNQTVAQIVKQIAEKFDLEADITDPGVSAGADLWDGSHYMPHAQQYWSILQDLAKQVGYECFVDENKKLFFGPPEKAAGERLTVTYGATNTSSVENPIKGLKITYQPRRNSNVQVEVISYHPHKSKQTKGKKRAKAKKGRATKPRKKGSFIVGSPTKGKQSAKAGGSKPSAKPTVTIRMDGLTKEQADKKAEAIAKDIAKRQIIVKGTIPGKAGLRLHSSFKIQKEKLDVLGFDAADYVLTAITHHLENPSSGSGAGWTTSITAMTEPEVE